MHSEVVGRGIPFAEGPVWCPDGTVVATSVAAGALFRVWPETATVERIADTTGGANGAALAADGTVTYLAREGFLGPNDLAVTRTELCTSPTRSLSAERGRARPGDDLRPRGHGHDVRDRLLLLNGIAFEPDRTVVVIERRGLPRVYADGGRDRVNPKLGRGGGDGFCPRQPRRVRGHAHARRGPADLAGSRLKGA